MPFSRPRHTSASPTDVLRLLEHLTSPAAAAPSTATTRRGGAFTPNFDVHETESAFMLEGEPPGLQDKSDVSIEFTDDNTPPARGCIRRRSPLEKQVVEKGGRGGQVLGVGGGVPEELFVPGCGGRRRREGGVGGWGVGDCGAEEGGGEGAEDRDLVDVRIWLFGEAVCVGDLGVEVMEFLLVYK